MARRRSIGLNVWVFTALIFVLGIAWAFGKALRQYLKALAGAGVVEGVELESTATPRVQCSSSMGL